MEFSPMLKKILKFLLFDCLKKNFEKYSFKDVLLAWSHFLKKSHQEPLLVYTLLFYSGPNRGKHNKLMANTKVSQIFLLGLF